MGHEGDYVNLAEPDQRIFPVSGGSTGASAADPEGGTVQPLREHTPRDQWASDTPSLHGGLDEQQAQGNYKLRLPGSDCEAAGRPS